jgi:hypothetical protein
MELTIAWYFLLKAKNCFWANNSSVLCYGSASERINIADFGAIQSEPHPVFAYANTPVSLARKEELGVRFK